MHTVHPIDAAFDHFQIATCMISEGDRDAAARELASAMRLLDQTDDDDLRDDINALLRSLRAA